MVHHFLNCAGDSGWMEPLRVSIPSSFITLLSWNLQLCPIRAPSRLTWNALFWEAFLPFYSRTSYSDFFPWEFLFSRIHTFPKLNWVFSSDSRVLLFTTNAVPRATPSKWSREGRGDFCLSVSWPGWFLAYSESIGKSTLMNELMTVSYTWWDF